MTADRTINFEMGKMAESWVTQINHVPDCSLAIWEGPQLLLAKVKDADGQDWYISMYILLRMPVVLKV